MTTLQIKTERPLPYHSRSYVAVCMVLSIIFILTSIIITFLGLDVLQSNKKIVGGDAYNYIIAATQSTAIVCMSIVPAIISLIFAVFALINKVSADRSGDKEEVTNV